MTASPTTSMAEADREQPLQSVSLDQSSVGTALHRDEHQTDTEEDGSRRRLGEAEATITEQRERRLERSEGDDRDEADDGQVAQHRRCRRASTASAGDRSWADASPAAGSLPRWR